MADLRANFYKANLARADLRGSNLSGANLMDANLEGANMLNANLSCVRMARAKINGAVDSHGRRMGAVKLPVAKKRPWWAQISKGGKGKKRRYDLRRNQGKGHAKLDRGHTDAHLCG